MTKKVLKIGFDLDGVLLYNPARIFRLPVVTFKHFFFPRREKKFLIPRHPLAKQIWKLAHLSSIFIAPGFGDLEKLIKKNHVDAYIITARYNFLDKNTDHWFKILNKNKAFKATYINQKNQQPHIYKQKLIDQLKLDVFIEDNYDIVSYLSKKTRTDIYWIYNLFDLSVTYPHKFSSLENVVRKITTLIKYEKK